MSESESDLVSAELQRLAATRAAIDPGRRRNRRDIVRSAALEVLTQRGEMTTEALLSALTDIFRTTAISREELDLALEEAKSAIFVEQVLSGDGETRWKVTRGSEEVSQRFRDEAREMLSRFEADVVMRLEEGGFDLTDAQTEKVPHQIYQILAAGCRKAANGRFAGSNVLRPVEFDGVAVRSALERIQPKSVRAAVEALTLAALDPDDPFGNELVHNLFVSSVLVAFVKKQDVAGRVDLNGVRLLLDTQMLVRLVDDGTPEQRVVKDLITLSIRLGATVIVGSNVLEQWDGLWESAEQQRADRIKRPTDLEAAARLVTNRHPFVAQYYRALEEEPGLTWRRFQITRQEIRSLLASIGVEVRPTGNTADEDVDFVEKMCNEMENIRTTEHVRASGGARGVEVDAHSAAMVARWRREGSATPCAAYFVGDDYLTGRAYKQLMPDDPTPLSVRPEAWLMFATCFTGDDPDLVSVAQVVSSAAVRESFFAAATSYPVSQVIEILDLMREDDQPMSLEISREATRLALAEFLDTAGGTDEEQARAIAHELMRRRAAQRDGLAKRAQTRHEEAVTRAHEEIARANARADAAAARAAAAEATAKTKNADLESVTNSLGKKVRQLWALVTSALVWGALIGLSASHVLHGYGVVIAVCLAVITSAVSVRWAEGEGHLRLLIADQAVSVAYLVLAWDWGIHHP